MNSVLDAQEQFSECFGDICLSDLTSEIILPWFSNEAYELYEFIQAHQKPAPVEISCSIVRHNGYIYYCYQK